MTNACRRSRRHPISSKPSAGSSIQVNTAKISYLDWRKQSKRHSNPHLENKYHLSKRKRHFPSKQIPIV